MNYRQKLRSLYTVLGYRFFTIRTPLSVSWSLTNRCNFKCAYCQVYQNKTNELSTKDVLRIIDELKEAGTVRIGFTGGEPFLRTDIMQILKKCRQNDIFVGIVTNGTIMKRNIEAIKLTDLIQISIDGSEEINDKQRCKGAFKASINTIRILKKLKKRFWITSVLSRHSFNQVDFLLDLAKKFNTKVYFQPCLDYELCGFTAKELVPETKKFRKVIIKLLELKKRGNKLIGNSAPGLKALLHYPDKSKALKAAKCYAGDLYCHIYSDGRLYSCFNMENENGIDLRKNSFKRAFKILKKPRCEGCFSYATIEMNLTLDLKPVSLWNTMRLMK